MNQGLVSSENLSTHCVVIGIKIAFFIEKSGVSESFIDLLGVRDVVAGPIESIVEEDVSHIGGKVVSRHLLNNPEESL